MKKSGFKKFKKGAASFYIVAVSTLILVIVAASFAAVIVSEVTRTSNDDLSQSAYDAALAGVEDAKLTFYNYQKCLDQSDETIVARMSDGSDLSCAALKDWVENGEKANLQGQDPCDIVANSLGRTIETEGDGTKKGVLVQEKRNPESEGGNNMEQYYTCVDIKTQTDDYLGTLTSEDTEHSVRIKFKKDSDEDRVYQDVDTVKISWQSFSSNEEGGGNSGNLFTWMTPSENGVFGPEKVTPAVIAISMVQTSSPFNLSQFDYSVDGRTDRGTVYLVPVNDELPQQVLFGESESYYSVVTRDGSGYRNETVDDAHGFLKSNDKGIKNKPVLVWCSKRSGAVDGYACEATLSIPKPVGGDRNEDTFVFSVSLPYGGPKTDYRLAFYNHNNMLDELTLDGVQVSIDSTGRANDLYRRVDTRLEASDASYPYPVYGIEALDPGSNPGIIKDFDTTCEYTFEATCP